MLPLSLDQLILLALNTPYSRVSQQVAAMYRSGIEEIIAQKHRFRVTSSKLLATCFLIKPTEQFI
jgi:hypothetical protein